MPFVAINIIYSTYFRTFFSIFAQGFVFLPIFSVNQQEVYFIFKRFFLFEIQIKNETLHRIVMFCLTVKLTAPFDLF